LRDWKASTANNGRYDLASDPANIRIQQIISARLWLISRFFLTPASAQFISCSQEGVAGRRTLPSRPQKGAVMKKKAKKEDKKAPKKAK